MALPDRPFQDQPIPAVRKLLLELAAKNPNLDGWGLLLMVALLCAAQLSACSALH
jgi:hypothetical protein